MKRTYFVKAGVLFLIVTFSQPSIYAQSKLGLDVGLAFGKINENFASSSLEYEYKSISRMRLGAFVDFPLSESVSLRPGFYYVGKGGSLNLEKEFDDIEGYDKLTLGYLEIPLNLVLHFSDRFEIGFGPYLAFAQSGKREYDVQGTINGVTIDAEDELDVVFTNQFDVEARAEAVQLRGFDMGFQLETSYRIGSFFPSITYSKGFRNLIPEPEFVAQFRARDMKTTNKYWSLSVAYMFDL